MTSTTDLVSELIAYAAARPDLISAAGLMTRAADALENAERPLTLQQASRLHHYDELKAQYVVERDLARAAELSRDEYKAALDELTNLENPVAQKMRCLKNQRDEWKAKAERAESERDAMAGALQSIYNIQSKVDALLPGGHETPIARQARRALGLASGKEGGDVKGE